MPRCPLCKHDNPTGVDLCKSCGARLGQAESEPAPPQSESTPDEAGRPEDDLENQVLPLLRQGRKIQAIKLYREKTGTGLKEAKDAVETIAAKHGVSSEGGGCARVLLLAIVAGATLAAWL